MNSFIYHLSSIFILLPSQFCAKLTFFASVTATDRAQLSLGSGRLTVLYDRVSPWPPKRPIQQQQCPLLLTTSHPNHRASIYAAIVRNPPPPGKTSCSPDFCNLSPPSKAPSMMTSNLGLFYVSSVSPLFVCFSQIELRPISLFILVPPGEIMTAARDHNIAPTAASDKDLPYHWLWQFVVAVTTYDNWQLRAIWCSFC